MAELILKVTPTEVRQVAGEITTLSGQMGDLMEDMYNLVAQQLLPVWDSTSGDQYRGKYLKVKNEINDSLTNLNQHVTNLRNAAEAYEKLETTQSQKVDQLNDSDIF